jgi:hypothetical protein
MISSRSHSLTNSEDSIDVEAYGRQICVPSLALVLSSPVNC